MTPQERAKQLTEAHWNGYVKPLLAAHGLQEDWLVTIGFHYKSSGIHFYGHAWEDFLNGMFGPSAIGLEPAPEPPGIYLHGTLCDTCARPDCAKGQYPATKDGGCEGYIRADSCTKCAIDDDECAEYRQPDLPCGDFSAKDAPTAAERPAPHTDPAVNCGDCSNTGCELLGAHVTQDSCASFKGKEAAK